ncbi:hypothetical protein O7634_06985 [Micromonospora sp. WMMD1120]|uniref:hypothetical protein n=1 Tax=Micromonospora sp. WMMD1120 TaxID=3016106 RepID=UPI0024173655|nr:hypothetical protein [Micromonospora sp. WMMD1120]MDG4806499.1 hypothetical protein [Micromonospora sp. WMMD1120]
MTADHLGALLSPLAEAVTVGRIIWTTKNHVVREGLIRVDTSINALAPCRLRVLVNERKPSEPAFQYLAGDGRMAFSARRLCINTPHRPFAGTHKHRVEPGGGEEAAYEPNDIPVVPLQPRVSPGTYRAILEAFAAECFITFGTDFGWSEP